MLATHYIVFRLERKFVSFDQDIKLDGMNILGVAVKRFLGEMVNEF